MRPNYLLYSGPLAEKHHDNSVKFLPVKIYIMHHDKVSLSFFAA